MAAGVVVRAHVASIAAGIAKGCDRVGDCFMQPTVFIGVQGHMRKSKAKNILDPNP